MRYSDNLKLTMPEQHEFYNIDILNDNFRKIDSLMGDAVGYTITQSETDEYKEIVQEYRDGRKVITRKYDNGIIKQIYAVGEDVMYEATFTKYEDGTIDRAVIFKE